jgi:NO-binding membrane sensor protein with MHYT domain
VTAPGLLVGDRNAPRTAAPAAKVVKGYYDPGLVALSVAIAIFASYTALDLANRVSASASSPKKAWTWLVAGALSMGTGIWAMHFVGMLAFDLPIPIAYDLSTTVLSMIIAIAVSAMALFILRQPEVTTRSWLAGAALMGIGISVMHYTGMMAMRMSPSISYDPRLFLISVLIAVLASIAALGIALQLRGRVSAVAMLARLGSAAVMGVAITGMHYTGMAAASFAPGSVCLAAASGGLQSTTLAIVIGCISMSILTLTIVLSALDSHFAAKHALHAASLQLAKDAADRALQENRQITAELVAAQNKLLNVARRAGMAEIATNVLHNVGNVLNSVNVSAGIIQTRLRESRVDGLTQGLQLMSSHTADLGHFFNHDPKGQRLPGYLRKLAENLLDEKHSVLEEIATLVRSIEHINDIVATQQGYAGPASMVELLQVEASIDDALRISAASMPGEQAAIVKELEPMPPVLLDNHLLLQILVNLLTNAKQAVEAVRERSHLITIRAMVSGMTGQPRVHIQVEDNGEGIEPRNLGRLFEHGFTTRKSGHGFGLHSSALAAHTMGGQLTAHSAGPGQGAVFTLDLPMQAHA